MAGLPHGPAGLALHLVFVSRVIDDRTEIARLTLLVPQRPQSALPERCDADEEHDYAEKDRPDGVWAPLILIGVAGIGARRLRRV